MVAGSLKSGYYEDGEWKRMQVLSRFSFESTEGRMLLCDLQAWKRDGIYILTDPAICKLFLLLGGFDESVELNTFSVCLDKAGLGDLKHRWRRRSDTCALMLLSQTWYCCRIFLHTSSVA